MPRLTGLVKPRQAQKYKVGNYTFTRQSATEQCPICKRYFHSVAHHQRNATACKEIKEAQA